MSMNLPNFKCYVRKEYLYNGEGHHGEFIPAVVYGGRSAPGKAFAFHVLTENGVLWDGLPAAALCFDEGAKTRAQEQLCLWDCFSFHCRATKYALLDGISVTARIKGETVTGKILFVLTWTEQDFDNISTDWTNMPEEHKTGNVIQLDDGNLAILPNNRILVHEPSFCTDPHTFDDPLDYKCNRQRWSSEGRWTSEDTDKQFYSVSEESD